MNAHAKIEPSIADDILEGADEIADFLGRRHWNAQRVYHARRNRSLPIRSLPGLGAIYALKSELTAAIKAADTLPQ